MTTEAEVDAAVHTARTRLGIRGEWPDDVNRREAAELRADVRAMLEAAEAVRSA